MKREALPTKDVTSLPYKPQNRDSMTTFYDNQPQSESLTLEQREARYQQERWMGEPETVADDWLFATLPSEKEKTSEEVLESLKEREQRLSDLADEALEKYQPVEEEDEDTPPEGTTVYNIETMLKGDFDEEGIPHVYQSQLWSYGELSRSEANEFLTTLNPDLILISFIQKGDYDEF